jgi:4-aminobutyrate aminotransferase-like enzyme
VLLERPIYDFPRITHGIGLRLFSEDGIEYLDAISGTFNLPLGYSHPDVVRAVQEQVKRVCHLSSDLVAPYSQALIDRLVGWAPAGIDSGWLRDLTGSTAIECAVKIAQKSTGATDVISLFFSHHGQTQFATAISGSAVRRKGFPGTVTGFSIRVPAPYCYRCFYAAKYPDCNFLCVDRIREFIEHSSNGSVACMIVEPILGNGGNIVPPPGYFDALNEFCAERRILLIADEVQTGIGRTGHMFASEALGLRPDIIVLAKGLGGIGIPIAAVLMKSELNVLEKFQHSFTSGSNLLGLSAAQATLDVISRPGFLAQVRHKGRKLGELLGELPKLHRCVGDVRGMGMMWGLEIVDAGGKPDPRKTKTIVELALKKYCLIIRSSGYGSGSVVKVRPALIATEEDLAQIVERLSQTLSDVS